jgi:hypothetical protein
MRSLHPVIKVGFGGTRHVAAVLHAMASHKSPPLTENRDAWSIRTEQQSILDNGHKRLLSAYASRPSPSVPLARDRALDL